ncbi:hypothetical protein ABEX47_17290 [Paenibacillus ehimensis]|uniref:hypothetical protein n=1 Tax=Paenibacillus ehimensis TaxID=79264 RepID=UPI002DB96DD7|nr:hypothetical protein [Paenibacillus ehimensis]MEC0211864.1 hypothetical protein [Paenibacillus ehimensis]
MSQRMEEPKTVSECWDIYEKFGFVTPKLPTDDSLFPNALQLVRMHNAHLDEIERLTKERDAFKVGRDNEVILKNEVIRKYEKLESANTAMREALEWYGDDANYKLGPNCGLGERARSVLAKIEEGEKP